MHINVSMVSETPAYEQIRMQIKEAVLKGRLEPGTCLPSIRLMAKDLGVGVITVKRAYEELEKENFILVKQGKGCFVCDIDREKVKRYNVEMLKERILDIKEFADSCGILKHELLDIINEIWGNQSE